MKVEKKTFITAGEYEIIVAGLVETSRFSGLDEVDITYLPGGRTRISGRYPDQAYLFGILLQFRDMAIPLVYVKCSSLEY